MSQHFRSIMDDYLSTALEPISLALQYVGLRNHITLDCCFSHLEKKRVMKD